LTKMTLVDPACGTIGASPQCRARVDRVVFL
jgi:hypothetical protein